MSKVRTTLFSLLIVVSTVSVIVSPASATTDFYFTSDVVTEHVGDTAYFQIETSGEIKECGIRIGNLSEDGYSLVASFNESILPYEEITLSFDTTAIGNPNEKTLRVVSNSFGKNPKLSLNIHREIDTSGSMEPGKYMMTLFDSRGKRDESILRLKSPPAPSSAKGVGRARKGEGPSEIVKSRPIFKSVAMGDKAVFVFEAPGTENFIKNGMLASKLRFGGKLYRNHSVYLQFFPTESSGSHTIPYSLKHSMIYRGSGDKIYVSVDISKYERISVGDSVSMELNVEKPNKYIESGKTSIKTKVVKRKGFFESTTSNGVIEVTPEQNRAILGETTLAPGTQVVIEVKNEDPYFYEQSRTTVGPNSTFRTRIDFNSFSEGDDLTMGFKSIKGKSKVSVVSQEKMNPVLTVNNSQLVGSNQSESSNNPSGSNSGKKTGGKDTNTDTSSKNNNTEESNKSGILVFTIVVLSILVILLGTLVVVFKLKNSSDGDS